MNCVCYDICVYQFWFKMCFSPGWGIPQLQSVAGACLVTTDLIMRVNVRTTQQHIPLEPGELVGTGYPIEKTIYRNFDISLLYRNLLVPCRKTCINISNYTMYRTSGTWYTRTRTHHDFVLPSIPDNSPYCLRLCRTKIFEM